MSAHHYRSFVGLLVALFATVALAEKMELSHTLAGQQNICFLEHIGEGVQGKYQLQRDEHATTKRGTT